MTDYDPWVPVGDLPTDGVAIRPAATMILVDDRPELQVLVLRRSDHSAFVGGHTVFPGGAVDSDDRDPVWSSLTVGITASEADQALRVSGARAFWIAAIRETIEEVGLVVGFPDQSLTDFRDVLDRGEERFTELVTATGQLLDLSGIFPISRWVTPMPSPRRYDTYFFLTRAPNGIQPYVDGREAVTVEWATPIEILERWSSGELTMISPTFATLQRLACYRSSEEALTAACKGGPPEKVRVIDEIHTPALFPADPGYRSPATRAVLGWTWLSDPEKKHH